MNNLYDNESRCHFDVSLKSIFDVSHVDLFYGLSCKEMSSQIDFDFISTYLLQPNHYYIYLMERQQLTLIKVKVNENRLTDKALIMDHKISLQIQGS